MAEVTDFRNNVLPYPIYGLPYTVSFPILDADGDPVSGAADLDSEISKNGDTPADCTNEAAEIGSSGTYYLTLTGTEMSCQCATICVKTSTSGAKTTVLTLYPQMLCQVAANKNPQGGDSYQITLAADAGGIDDMWRGYIVAVTLDGVVQVRTIVTYAQSTKIATVVPDWDSDPPDTDDVYYLYMPPGAYMPSGTWGPVTAVTGAVGSVTGAVGSVTGAVGSVTAGVTLADDAITAAKFDESTAFPLTSADTGATAVARTGDDSDTLETLSDQLDGVSTFDASSDGVNVTKWTGETLSTPGDAGWNGN